MVGFGNRSDRNGGDLRLVADLVGKRRLKQAAVDGTLRL